jgi:hypothetical protein
MSGDWRVNSLPLPVPFPHPANAALHRQTGDGAELIAIGDAAVIFPPRHFVGIRGQIRASDLVMRAGLRTAEAREVAFRHVGPGEI